MATVAICFFHPLRGIFLLQITYNRSIQINFHFSHASFLFLPIVLLLLLFLIAGLNDIENICTLVREAIKHMENQGIYQWDALYPTREDFIEDICKNSLYVVEDSDRLAAIYTISKECDDEYNKCAWNNPNETACVIQILIVNGANNIWLER